MATRYIIVGVDPGTTTAVAAIDLRGRIVGLHSSKDMGLAETVKYILSVGRPSLVASDVNPPPDFVASVATKFGVTLFIPEKTLSVTDKLDLTRPHSAADAHQRDALAAALNAQHEYGNKLRKAESIGLPDEAKHLVLQGHSISAARAAIERTEPEPEEEKPAEPEKPRTDEERMLRDLQKRIKNLQELISEKDARILELNVELAQAKRVKHLKPERKSDEDKRIQTLQARLTRQDRIERLLKRIISGEAVPVGLYPQTIGGLAVVEVKPDDIRWIKAAFTSKKRIADQLIEQNIPVYDSKEVENDSGYRYITKKTLQELMKPKPEKPDIEKIINEYRQKR
ncbi:MAG: DUF460 domain-containing protein [Candidatus Altiarchaeota archaeon]